MFRRESETAALYPMRQLSNEYFNFEKIRHIKALRIVDFLEIFYIILNMKQPDVI